MKTLNQLIKQHGISKVNLAEYNGVSKQRLNGWLNLGAAFDNSAQIDLFQKAKGDFYDNDLFPVDAKYKLFKTLNIPGGEA